MGRECLGYRALQELGEGYPRTPYLRSPLFYLPVSLSQFPSFSDSHNTKRGKGLCRCLSKGWVVFRTSREGLCFNDQPRAGYRSGNSGTYSWGSMSQKHISGGQGDNVGSRNGLCEQRESWIEVEPTIQSGYSIPQQWPVYFMSESVPLVLFP